MSSQEQFRENMIKLLVDEQLPLELFIKKAAKYGVSVVIPGQIFTADCKLNFTRFFPNVSNGKVSGGNFG